MLFRHFACGNDKFAVFTSVGHFLCVILAGKLDLTVFIAEEFCRYLSALRSFKRRFYRPVFLRNESLYLRFSFDDYSRRNRLNSSCGKSAANGFPKVRTDFVAHYSVKNSSCLLRVYKVHIYCARMLHSGKHRFLCYIIEGYSVRFFRLYAENRCKMPRYSFSLAVGIGCEVYLIGIFNFLFKLIYYVRFSLYVNVFHRKVMVSINSERTFRKVSDMSDRRHDFIFLAEIGIYCGCLIRRLDYYKIMLHFCTIA